MRFEGSWRVVTVLVAGLVAGCTAPSPVRPDGDLAARTAAESACVARTTRGLGAEVATVHDFRPEARQRAAKLLGIDDALQVVAIEPASAADRAGLRVGDVVEAIDDERVAPGARARDTFLAAVELSAPERVLHVRRAGTAVAVPIAARSACATGI